MKKPLIALNVILLLAVVGLYIIHFTSSKGDTAQPGKSDGDDIKKKEISNVSKTPEIKKSEVKQTQKTEIVYVNSDTIMAKYNFAVQMRKNLESEGKGIENQFKNRERQLQNQMVNLQKRVQEGKIKDEAQYKKEAQALANKEQKFIADRQASTNSFIKKENDANKKLYDKVHKILKAYCIEKGYKMVLTYSKLGGSVLYGDEKLDVTDEVVEKLNASE